MSNAPRTADPEATQTPHQALHRLDLPGVAYDDIPAIRADALRFLESNHISPSYARMLALTITEILTNLARHPPEKATRAGLRLRLSGKTCFIDVSDNSTPFAAFEEKCRTALARLDAGRRLAESGYGLGMILKQHTQVNYTPAPASPDGMNHFRVRGDESAQPATAHRSTVYLVDDDPVAMKRHCRMLEDSYTLSAFGRAEELIRAFVDKRPDLVISDINMPGMDGLELRRALSELDGGNAVPFIFLSGETSLEHSSYVSELGVDDFLCKPVEAGRLQTVAARLITRSLQLRHALEGKFQQHLTRMLRPELPEAYGGWRIVTMTEAAEAGGGDFTLWQETPAHMLAVLADVMGHGPQAKFFSYAYAGYLRSLFRTNAAAADPAQFLHALSQSIEGDTFLESILLTCQGFQLFPKGRVCIASAGHPAPMVLRASGAAVLPVAGPLPALASVMGYQMHEEQLLDGEKIIFATDGFLQPFEAEGFRRGWLLKMLDGLAGASAEDTAQALWRAYADKNRALQSRDDATLIVAGYGGI